MSQKYLHLSKQSNISNKKQSYQSDHNNMLRHRLPYTIKHNESSKNLIN
jgi:hypothetical protein